MTDKAEVRRALVAARDALSAASRAGLALRLHARLDALAPLRAARRVLVYVARGAEVPTEPVARALLARGVEVAVPRIVGVDLLPCPIASWADLVPGAFGIATSDAAPWTGAIDVVIAPGAGFDRLGHRLGLGRGFYDRLLGSRRVAYVVGVCWGVQLVDRVPTDVWDQPVDAVVTPEETIFR